MPTYNYVSGTLTAAQVTAITTAIATIRTNLPFLHPLSSEDRHALPKMGQKSQPFVIFRHGHPLSFLSLSLSLLHH